MPTRNPPVATQPVRRGRFAALYDRPYLLLSLANLFWSGNFIVGRAVHESMPPVALAFCRWFGGFVVVIGLAWPHLKRDWPQLWRHWPLLLLLSATGIAAFNTLVYVGLGSTTALNGLLEQSTMPVVILLCSLLLFGERPSPRQIAGIAVSLAGVVIIITQGEVRALGSLALNRGDLWIFAAVVAYSVYSALLRRRPIVHPLSFLAATFALGTAMLLPFLLWEGAAGAAPSLGAPTVLAVLYVAIFPSVLAYFFWNRGVEIIGANRAGQFVHLMPIFGSVLAVVVLGEAFRGFHAAGAALIFAGIVLATRRA